MNFNENRYSLFLNIRNGATHKAIEAFEQGADIEIKLNKFQWTPLHTAAYQGNLQLVEYLLRKGADREAANSSGLTPGMLAEMNGHHEISRMLGEGAKEEFEVIEVEAFTAVN